MDELRHQRDLALEPLGTDGIRQMFREHFDGDLAIEVSVVRAVDYGHSAASNLAVYSEARRQPDLTGQDRRHRTYIAGLKGVRQPLGEEEMSYKWKPDIPEIMR